MLKGRDDHLRIKNPTYVSETNRLSQPINMDPILNFVPNFSKEIELVREMGVESKMPVSCSPQSPLFYSIKVTVWMNKPRNPSFTNVVPHTTHEGAVQVWAGTGKQGVDNPGTDKLNRTRVSC